MAVTVNGPATGNQGAVSGAGETVALTSFSASGDGTGIDAPFARAVAALAGSGAIISLPGGRTWDQEATLVLPETLGITGAGRTSIIRCAADIEQIASSRVSGQSNTGIWVGNLRLADTRLLSSAITRTKYQLRLTNSIGGKIKGVETSTMQAASPDRGNLGGIHLERFGDSECYVNELMHNWVRQGVLRLEGTDNKVLGGFYWGDKNPAAVIVAGGNTQLVGVDFVGSPDSGSISVPTAQELLSVVGCFFDGSNTATGGHGIVGKFDNATISGNRFWYHQKAGILMQGGQSNAITGNNFCDNNRSNGSWSDVMLQPASGAVCKGNVVSGNAFKNSAATSNKAYCIEENDTVAGSGATGGNNFFGNTRSVSFASGYAGYIKSDSRANQPSYDRSIIGPNPGMNQFNDGLGYVLDGQSSVIVTHNLGTVPLAREIRVRANDSTIGARQFYVDTLTSTTFRVVLSSAASGANIPMQWAIGIGT